MPDTDPLTDVEIDAELADRLRDAQQAYDEVRAYLDSVKDEIKARYIDHEGVRGVHNGEQVFTCIRRTSTRFNSSKLRDEYPSVWAQFTTTTTAVYMTIARLEPTS